MRVTAEEVKQILHTTLSDASLDAFIRSADILIDTVYAESTVSDALKKQISLWLSAHFASARERQESEVEISGSRAKFGGMFGKGLEFTQYGQQVLVLDPTGKFADIGKPKSSMEVLSIEGVEDTA